MTRRQRLPDLLDAAPLADRRLFLAAVLAAVVLVLAVACGRVHHAPDPRTGRSAK